MYDHFNLCVILDCTTGGLRIVKSAFFSRLPRLHTYAQGAGLRAGDLAILKTH